MVNAKTIEKHLNLFYSKPTALYHLCQAAFHCLWSVIYCLQRKCENLESTSKSRFSRLDHTWERDREGLCPKTFTHSLFHHAQSYRQLCIEDRAMAWVSKRHHKINYWIFSFIWIFHSWTFSYIFCKFAVSFKRLSNVLKENSSGNQ